VSHGCGACQDVIPALVSTGMTKLQTHKSDAFPALADLKGRDADGPDSTFFSRRIFAAMGVV